MSKMTCEFTRVVHINFRGYKLPEDEGTIRYPRDEGMVTKILDFIKEHDIYPANWSGAVGGGIYVHSFFEDDAMKILKVRYAKGEITKEEYEQMKKDMS